MLHPNRRFHYLSRPKLPAWPARVICFNCNHVLGGPAQAGPGTAVEMDGWSIVVLTHTGSGYTAGGERTGDDGPSLWDQMGSYMIRKKQVVAMGFGVAFALALSGFWDLVKGGKWEVTTVFAKAAAGGTSTARVRFKGFVCLEDAPTIVLARQSGKSGTLKMLDAKNYGVKSMPPSGRCQSQAHAVADWFKSYHAVATKLNLGGLQNTAASQSAKGWQANYMRDPVLSHCNTAALELERNALFTGRNECYAAGKVLGPVYHLDFNSHYAAVARSLACPARLIGSGLASLGKVNELRGRGYTVAADVLLITKEPNYPKRIKGQPVFPTGRFKTSLAGPELDHALDAGVVKEVGYVAWYEPEVLFGTLLDAAFRLRESCAGSHDCWQLATSKSLAVGLFGKFAQWHWRWQASANPSRNGPFCEWYEPRLDDGEWCKWRAIGGKVEYEGPKQEPETGCPAITAWICSAARLKLLTALALATRAHCCYCDADSLWVDLAGLSSLRRAGYLDDKEPGKLKLVAEHPWVIFHGLKHYETPTEQVHSGVPDGASRIGNWSFEWLSSERVASACARGQAPRAELMRRRRISAADKEGERPSVMRRVPPLFLWEE